MSLRIQHAGGVRVIPVYRVPSRNRSFDTATLNAEYALGDGQEKPYSFAVEVELTADTFQDATALAYTVIEEAQAATFVEYHRGTIDVNKLVSHEMRGDALAVVLRLTWRVTQTGLVIFGWDRTDVTFDQTDITFDRETIEE